MALGGSFAALEAAIASSSAGSQEDFEEWARAGKQLRVLLAEIDAQRSSDAPLVLASVREPAVDDEIDSWVGDHDLGTAGVPAATVDADLGSALVSAGSEFLTAVHQLDSAGDRFQKTIAQELAGIYAKAVARPTLEVACPVCRSEQPDWVEKLATTIADNHELEALRGNVSEALAKLNRVVEDGLLPVLSIATSSGVPNEIQATAARGAAVTQKLRTAVSLYGTKEGREVIAAAMAVVDWLEGDAGATVTFAIEASDHMQQWKVARAAAAAPFVALWREKQSTAREAQAWKAANGKVDTLRTRLRERRTTTLGARANEQVESLLADAGMKIADIKVGKREASIEIQDQMGKPLTLGMLSAGQRNAVLLAPLLASIDAGPFGFVVLDDPVHAFDELRIDRLASALATLAVERRVVVLTHDERLYEHLMAAGVDCEGRSVSREPSTGVVAVDACGYGWERLLDDAEILLRLGVSTPGSALSVTDAVRGLCRQAVDNAARMAVIRHAARTGVDVAAELAGLDVHFLTRQRLEHVAGLVSADAAVGQAVGEAMRHCQPYESAWNRAAHGNAAESSVEAREIGAARAACVLLASGLV